MLKPLLEQLELPSPIVEVSIDQAAQRNVRVYMKRDDLIHPLLCGNKWRKLKYNLVEAIEKKHDSLISFGGAYSNHLVALATAGFYLGIKTCGIIRSYKDNLDNPTIRVLRSHNMDVHFVHPRIYNEKETHPEISHLLNELPNSYLIPEGGSNFLALKGVAEMMEEIDIESMGLTHVISAVGTGGTIAGIIKSLPDRPISILGISPFKGQVTELAGFSLLNDEQRNKVKIITSHPATRFGAHDCRIESFIDTFKSSTGILLDPIYTAKTVMTVISLLEKEHFKPGDKIMIIHTGGIQGNLGYAESKIGIN